METVIESNIIGVTLLLMTALGACAAAFFTCLAARATAKANRGQTLLACLDKYMSIMKDKRKAEESEEVGLAKEFYRELFDLHWSEFNLWHDGAIPNNVMRAWVIVRKRNFDKDMIVCTFQKRTEEISYADEWEYLKETEYFEKNDPFVHFMNKVHKGYTSNMKQLKKDTKKWEPQ